MIHSFLEEKHFKGQQISRWLPLSTWLAATQTKNNGEEGIALSNEEIPNNHFRVPKTGILTKMKGNKGTDRLICKVRLKKW